MCYSMSHNLHFEKNYLLLSLDSNIAWTHRIATREANYRKSDWTTRFKSTWILSCLNSFFIRGKHLKLQWKVRTLSLIFSSYQYAWKQFISHSFTMCSCDYNLRRILHFGFFFLRNAAKTRFHKASKFSCHKHLVNSLLIPSWCTNELE